MSNCSCVYVGNYDALTIIKEKNVRARKNHTCGECARKIEMGEKYEYVFAVLDGDVRTYITCVDCLSIRNSFYCEGWVYGRVIEMLEDHIEDAYGSISSDCITPLTKSAKDVVCDMIQACWDRLLDDEY